MVRSVRRPLDEPNARTRSCAILPLLTCLLLLAGCRADDGEELPREAPRAGDSVGQGRFDWQAHAGSRIRVLAYNDLWGRTIQERLGEFTDLTGIEVDLELLQVLQARDRVRVELQASDGELDAFVGPPREQGRTFHDAGWYADLDAYASDPDLTGPGYDFGDFRANLVRDHTFDSTLIGIPTEVRMPMLFYRADILLEAGMEVPTTFDELREVLEEIDQTDGVRGWSARSSAASASFTPFLYHMGATWISERNEPGFDTPEGIDAFELYTDLIDGYGPPDAADRAPRETLALMTNGDLAMTADISWEIVADAEHSVVVDTVEFAPVPGGPGGAEQAYTTEALSVSALSDDQEAAWYFVQWATGPEMVARLQTELGIAGGRRSIEEFAHQPQSWVKTYLEGIDEARPVSPDVPEGAKAMEAIDAAIQEILDGKEVERAVDEAAEEFRRVVEGS